MEDKAGLGHPNATTGARGGTSPCRRIWSAFNAHADVPHPPEPLGCQDYTRVQRDCRVEKDALTGRDVLYCHERRDKFRLCTERHHTNASQTTIDQLSTTEIETRDPLLNGHMLVATRGWEPVSSRIEASGAESSAPPASHPVLDRALDQQQASASGRAYLPWDVRADDGLSRGPGAGSSAALLTPQVGHAYEDLIMFADEMQRDLALHGLELIRRGREQQQQERKQPGLLTRLFGGWGGDGGKGWLAPAGGDAGGSYGK
ncbi:hypothetical protein Agub_g15149 [Astrephomene gubernaculifera]|uniref:Uncharacterized protein n=1 Tax=Astrephomene gubernaculifera TaxID=47775 RepID=A0AAD3E2J4_9CHLO|nr:hypothetical protein Agub_g15149 [Astrephomene gubernaculifera]